MLRTHTCGELKTDSIGKSVVLTGWVASRRNLGSMIFLDLRDRYGITQITLNPQRNNPELMELAQNIGVEWVISVTGKVIARTPQTVNPKMITGEIEIEVSDIKILSKA